MAWTMFRPLTAACWDRYRWWPVILEALICILSFAVLIMSQTSFESRNYLALIVSCCSFGLSLIDMLLYHSFFNRKITRTLLHPGYTLTISFLGIGAWAFFASLWYGFSDMYEMTDEGFGYIWTGDTVSLSGFVISIFISAIYGVYFCISIAALAVLDHKRHLKRTSIFEERSIELGHDHGNHPNASLARRFPGGERAASSFEPLPTDSRTPPRYGEGVDTESQRHAAADTKPAFETMVSERDDDLAYMANPSRQ